MNTHLIQTTNGTVPAAKLGEEGPVERILSRVEIVDRTSDRYLLGLEPGVGTQEAQDAAWDIAKAAAEAKLAPSAEEAYARILIGRPLGVPAMASIQGIALIETKTRDGEIRRVACMYAKLKLGLLQARKDVVEYVRPKPGGLTNKSATWVAKRVGDPEPIEYTFTIEDAQIAGLVGRGDGKTNSAGANLNNYDRHPGPMLQWRACGRLCDIVGADVLNALATREDLEDELRMARAELEELAAAAGRGELRQALESPPQAKPAKDFGPEAEAIKQAFADAIAKKDKPALKVTRERFAKFKTEAPAELSEDVQRAYNVMAGEARKTPAAQTNGAPAPADQASSTTSPSKHATPYLPPDQRGDSYDGPEDPLT